MRLVTRNFHVHKSISSQSTAAPPEPPHSMPEATGSFPIIAVALIGILATAFLLVSYYVFVIKCCLTWRRIDLLHRLSFSTSGHHTSAAHLADARSRRPGLDDTAIRSIPVFLFRVPDSGSGPSECAVCLAEFRDGEKLRRIPNCAHVFHIDCIDVWLQANTNCPLCRTNISGGSEAIRIHFDPTLASDPPPSVPDPDPSRLSGRGFGDFVVIELDGDSTNDGDLSGTGVHGDRNMRKVYSIGDEIVDFRVKDERFAIQAVRRSFSLDSSNDPMFYKSIQEIAQQHRRCGDDSEGCSSSRARRSLFSFSHGKVSRREALCCQ